MTDPNELTPEEEDALRRLAGEGDVPPSLEDRTLARLRRRGLLGARGERWRIRLLAAAAGIALFTAGLFVGDRRASDPSPPVELPRYVLLLYDAPDEAGLPEGGMEARVEEYRNWAMTVRREGGEITGEKLGARETLLGPPIGGPGARSLGGYFVIGAKDAEAAEAVARSCPHLKHGGSIAVRPIAKT